VANLEFCKVALSLGARRLIQQWRQHERPSLADAKQLFIGVALHLLRGEIRRAWIHPSADGHLGMTVGAMAHTAIVAVKHSSTTIDASFSDLGARRYSFAACAVNQKISRFIADEHFKAPGFIQCRQVEAH
jgi:hypothetical protein